MTQWRYNLAKRYRENIPRFLAAASDLGFWELSGAPGEETILLEAEKFPLPAKYWREPGQPLRLGDFQECVHPDDRDIFRRRVRELLDAPGQTGAVQYRAMLRGERTWQWLRGFGVSFMDKETGLVAALGGTSRVNSESVLERIRVEGNRALSMLDSSPMATAFFSENMRAVDCNRQTVKLFGFSSREEYLNNFYKVWPTCQPGGELSYEVFRQKCKEALAAGQPVTFDFMHRDRRREPIPCELTIVPARQGERAAFMAYARDTRERNRIAAELREADDRMRLIFDSTPISCNLSDEDYNIIDCNAGAVALFDFEAKDEYMRNYLRLFPKYQPDGELSMVKSATMRRRAIETGQPQTFDFTYQKLDGTPMPCETVMVRTRWGGQTLLLTYNRDLRQHNMMMDEIRQVEADLRRARDAAERNAKYKSEFLANMSHEIRTPMNAILGMIHLAQDDVISPGVADYLRKAETSTKTLLRVINDILDFSRIESGRLQMEDVDFDLPEVLQQMSYTFGPAMEKKGLRLEVKADPGLPKKLRGDPLRLSQVLVNLIGNAVKFTGEGGVGLAVSEKSRSGGRVRLLFAIKDTGIGMTEAQARSVFDPFTQGDSSTTRKYGGTGLGLPISRNLAQLMHGDIECESHVGVGTTFRVTLEFGLVDEEESEEREAEAALAAIHRHQVDWHELKPVLLVEDNDLNQLIAKKMLEKRGLKVEVANNGQEALDKLLAPGAEYELVLMDVQMPVMDGLTATRRIRTIEKYRNLPIIALTAHAMSGDREKSLEAGMNDHVTKPLDVKLLYATLERWIERNN